MNQESSQVLVSVGGCGSPHWKGDKICDDDNNNAGCDFDGGDCCGKDVETHYCDKCECLEKKKKVKAARPGKNYVYNKYIGVIIKEFYS